MGRLAGGIAHVINNLMTIVLGRAELSLMTPGATPEIRENLKAVSEAARRAAGLAERLLGASGRRMRDGRTTRTLDVVLGQREAMEQVAGPDRVLTWDLAEGDALVPTSDLEAVLLELVSNAADATASGGRITIRVRDETLEATPARASRDLPPGRYSILDVEDDGRGVAGDVLPHIFEPFYSTRPSHEGRGLGLSVVHGIVAKCGGAVLVDTEPGAGTRVHVYLPQSTVKAA
jgi:signal transduction histidine kinase